VGLAKPIAANAIKAIIVLRTIVRPPLEVAPNRQTPAQRDYFEDRKGFE
jgi:hypothetical protein